MSQAKTFVKKGRLPNFPVYEIKKNNWYITQSELPCIVTYSLGFEIDETTLRKSIQLYQGWCWYSSNKIMVDKTPYYVDINWLANLPRSFIRALIRVNRYRYIEEYGSYYQKVK